MKGRDQVYIVSERAILPTLILLQVLLVVKIFLDRTLCLFKRVKTIGAINPVPAALPSVSPHEPEQPVFTLDNIKSMPDAGVPLDDSGFHICPLSPWKSSNTCRSMSVGSTWQ